MKKNFNGKFIIPAEVYYEIVERPIKIKRFELEALRLKQLVKEGILELPSSIGIEDKEIAKGTKEILDFSNKIFTGNKKNIHLIDLGEAGCLALSKILDEKKIEHAIAVDERTTRMIGEKPKNLKELLQKKLHVQIHINPKNLDFFKSFKYIRSTELIYVAYKKGLIKLDDKQILDALLWGLKFKGCAISTEEIKEIENIK